jgi:F-type H+-transporting ATPase subunit a
LKFAARLLAVMTAVVSSTQVLAESGEHAEAAAAHGGGGHGFSVYGLILEKLHIDAMWLPTVGGLAALAVLTLVGLAYKGAVARAGGDDVPEGRFNLRFVVESILDIPYSIARDNCGHYVNKFFPFLAAIFSFILVCNLSGMIPGFPAATASMATNVAIGILVFLVYNVAGIKENGGGYIKHFLGPVVWIAPLFFLIELISHGARPFSLGLRLMGNLFADHTLLGEFIKLTYVGLPAVLMFFGLLVAIVQSFVFTLLSGIYISMSIAHDH